MSNELVEKYRHSNLGGADYTGPGAETYTADQLANPEEVYLIMWEINNHEGSLTKDGMTFLEKFYGLNVLARIIEESGGLDSKNYRDILDWLNSLKEWAVR